MEPKSEDGGSITRPGDPKLYDFGHFQGKFSNHIKVGKNA